MAKWLMTGRCSDPRAAERVSLGSVANDPTQSFSSPLNWNRRGVQGAAAGKQKARRLFFCARNVSLQGSSEKREPSLLSIQVL